MVGPAGSVDEALRLIGGKIDAAFLDGNLPAQLVDDVATLLRRRNVPFCFVSGYGRENLPAAFPSASIVRKPLNPRQLLAQAATLVSDGENIVRLRHTAGGWVKCWMWGYSSSFSWPGMLGVQSKTNDTKLSLR